MKKTIRIAKEFSQYLFNRDSKQGDGTNTAVEFREKFLTDLESDAWWKDPNSSIVFDFEGVVTLGPSWANGVFAYYTCKHSLSTITSKFEFINLSRVKMEVINFEIEAGYFSRKLTPTERARQKGFDLSSIKENPAEFDVFTGKRSHEE